MEKPIKSWKGSLLGAKTYSCDKDSEYCGALNAGNSPIDCVTIKFVRCMLSHEVLYTNTIQVLVHFVGLRVRRCGCCIASHDVSDIQQAFGMKTSRQRIYQITVNPVEILHGFLHSLLSSFRIAY
jgi:hypothetical protein